MAKLRDFEARPATWRVRVPKNPAIAGFRCGMPGSAAATASSTSAFTREEPRVEEALDHDRAILLQRGDEIAHGLVVREPAELGRHGALLS